MFRVGCIFCSHLYCDWEWWITAGALLFFWNCIHSGSIPAADCSLHLEFLPWGYMNRRKEAVNERAEEEKRFLPQKPFFIMVATADHRWISWPRMKTLSVGFDPLRAWLQEFASYLSQNHLAQGLDVITFALSVQRIKISRANDYNLGEEAILLRKYIQIYL